MRIPYVSDNQTHSLPSRSHARRRGAAQSPFDALRLRTEPVEVTGPLRLGSAQASILRDGAETHRTSSVRTGFGAW